ncbi:hypothetical protein [Paenibacillus sp. MDMC362]|uniref:hypothetical protein n=1 Tax=Paenibacillus sp. MDMC362 TaxID=2977365 RepID=UPI000DC5D960|nr:hypothetical protein [Paenibacillus sp. MDMC362]RAR39647.1 hypothetical protein DP091_29620 [Paenibacillus sp. MDMC362]
MGATVVQMEIYPSVTEAERKTVKKLLTNYPKLSRQVNDVRRRDPESLTPQQQKVLNEGGRILDEINVAVGLIIDEEVKKIFEHRYIKGVKYSGTIDAFWSERGRSEKTIDRRIGVGVDTIAEHLKLCGIIGKSDGKLTLE